MQKRPLKIVNFYYGFRCNLACQGCFSGSNIITHKKHDPDLETIFETIDNLSKYVSDITIMATLLGGEPFLYWPEKIVPMMYKIREHWPNATLNLSTNGLLLHKFTNDIIDVFKDLKNAKIQISKHASNTSKLRDQYEKNLQEFLSHPELYKIHDNHYTKPGDFGQPLFDVHIEPWTQPFTSQFLIRDNKLKPFATNDPEGSMRYGCTGNICSMVIENKLYKCSRLAALPKILLETDQLDDPDWQKYLHTYVDLTTSEQSDIDKFHQEEGRPIAQCDVCPNRRDSNTLIPRTDRTILPIKIAD